jgi:DNA-binding CsgD family transcriptional regulator
MRDPIAIVEAAYDLGPSSIEAWIQQLLTSALPLAGTDLGGIGYTFDLRQTDWLGEIVLADAERPLAAIVRSGYAMLGPIERDRLLSGEPAMVTMLERFARDASIIGRDPTDVMGHVSQGLFADASVACARNLDGRGCVLGFPHPHAMRIAARSRAAWERVMRHVAAGLRLRTALAEQCSVDAVLDAEGREHDVSAPAQAPDLRAALRRAVLAREKARGALRRSSEVEALDLWQVLVAGTWSLVDRFDSDARRYVVAMRNEPFASDARALTRSEEMVVRYARLGHSNKWIGYSLGVSPQTVATLLARAMRKLRVRTRVELVQLLGALDTGEVSNIELGGAELAVAHSTAGAMQGVLTARQREIAQRALGGESNAVIAAALGVSRHTVANTMRAVFERLGVRSRAELARRASASLADRASMHDPPTD